MVAEPHHAYLILLAPEVEVIVTVIMTDDALEHTTITGRLVAIVITVT